MSRFIASIAGILITAGLSLSQTTLSKATDFTVTDISGKQQNLYSYLGAGKYVLLDFLSSS